MSHIVLVRTEVRDHVAVKSACLRLRWEEPTQGTHKMFSQTIEGLAVKPPNWVYPIVCNLQSGELSYDNFEGRWGDPRELGRFKQAYAIEKAKLEARRQGRTVTEQSLADGTIELTVSVEGAAA